MKTFGWTSAVLCAILTTTFVFSGSRENSAKAAPAIRVAANQNDLASEAGMRFRFSQTRHWRQLVLGR